MAAEQARERAGDEVVELGAGQPDIGLEAGQIDGHRGGGLRRESLLGLPALVAQAGQRADRSGARRIGVVGIGDAGDDVVEDGLVDLVAGKVCVPDGFADRREVRTRVGERDAGSAAAQVDEGDDAAARQSGRGLQRGERGDGVRYQRGRAHRPAPGSACRAGPRARRR